MAQTANDQAHIIRGAKESRPGIGNRGNKKSGQREAVYGYIASGRAHPTAEEVYAALKIDMPKLSLGTVYRNLALMTEQGRLLKIGTDERAHYDADTKPHVHALCLRCQRVIDVEGATAPADTCIDGFEITGASLTYYGICDKCK